MKGIVNKPQFNSEIFKQGTALQIKSSNPNDHKLYRGSITNCLVSFCGPLILDLVFIDKVKGCITTKVPIENIELYEIKFLVPEES
jgi:hypothetical protein